MPYYKKSDAELDAKVSNVNYPNYRFTVKTIKSRHGDRFVMNCFDKRGRVKKGS